MGEPQMGSPFAYVALSFFISAHFLPCLHYDLICVQYQR